MIKQIKSWNPSSPELGAPDYWARHLYAAVAGQEKAPTMDEIVASVGNDALIKSMVESYKVTPSYHVGATRDHGRAMIEVHGQVVEINWSPASRVGMTAIFVRVNYPTCETLGRIGKSRNQMWFQAVNDKWYYGDDLFGLHGGR